MSSQRGHARRLAAAVAATAMCGAGLVMSAGVAQANPVIQTLPGGGVRPYTAPFDPFPSVFLLPPGTVNYSPSGQLDISNWAWTQLDHDQSAMLINSGAVQAVADANIKFISPAAKRMLENRAAIDAGGCYSVAYNTNPGDYMAGLSGDHSVITSGVWALDGDSAVYCGQ